MNKNLEKLAMLVVILWCISLIPTPLANYIAARLYGHAEYMQYNALRSAFAASTIILGFIVHIGVAVWLYIQARRNCGTPWLWALFGLTTGLTAAILYWLGEIRDHLIQKKET